MERVIHSSLRRPVLRICVLVAFLIAAIPAYSIGLGLKVVPDDLPTTEVLIDLHKKIKKDEDAALERITASTALQDIIAKGTKKFKESRDSLDSKLNNAYSYVLLAAAISTTANSLYRLLDDYKDFTTNTYKYVAKKPFVAWYYMNANAAIAREVKHCRSLYLMMAASGVNIWRASMSDKINLIYTLKNSIDKARSIIHNANTYCYLIVNTDWRPDYIWEILTSDLKDEIANALIARWKNNQ